MSNTALSGVQLTLKGWASGAQLATAAGHLREASILLRTDGWIQGALRDAKGGRCIGSAIMSVSECGGSHGVNSPEWFDCPVVLAGGAFNRVMGVDIAAYNDHPGRTLQEVQNALQHVANECQYASVF